MTYNVSSGLLKHHYTILGTHIRRGGQYMVPGRLSISSFRGRQMSSRLQLDVYNLSLGMRHLVNAYEVEAGTV